MRINYQKFIEDNFAILDREKQIPVPFRLNEVQKEYCKLISEDYPDWEGIREIVLKARQEGMSSFILALFTVDFICIPHSVSVCVSHKKDATELLFRKVKFYLESYCAKNGLNVKDFLNTETKGLLTSSKKSMFYVGTAGSKVGGRGGSARNILFSEAAFYQDTDIITAEEIIIGTAQQVPQGRGMIFIESTANGMENYYYDEWQRAMESKSAYHPRFFGWDKFYTEEWVNQKKKEFQSEAKWRQEYPRTPDEAFIASGTPYFDNQLLADMLEKRYPFIQQGRIAADGNWI